MGQFVRPEMPPLSRSPKTGFRIESADGSTTSKARAGSSFSPYRWCHPLTGSLDKVALDTPRNVYRSMQRPDAPTPSGIRSDLRQKSGSQVSANVWLILDYPQMGDAPNCTRTVDDQERMHRLRRAAPTTSQHRGAYSSLYGPTWPRRPVGKNQPDYVYAGALFRDVIV